MAATVPVRMDKELVAQASAEAERQKRTAPKQIEYWAALGQTLEGVIGQEDVIRLREGLLRLQPVNASPVDADRVFATVDAARTTSKRSTRVTSARVIYQASRDHPRYLEQIHADGRVIVGRFENGQFKPRSGPRSE